VGIKSNYFSRFYASLPVTDQYRLTLLNDRGVQLARFSRNDSSLLGQKTPIREFDTHARDKTQAAFTSTIPSLQANEGSLNQIIAIKPVPAVPMFATASVNSRVYLRQWRWNANAIAIGGACVTIATLLMTFAALRVFHEMETHRAVAMAHAGAKSRFLSAMSHEIRTPLNSITASAELLLDYRIPPDAERFTRAIQRSSKHLLYLVNDILDFARLEAGKHRFESGPFELLPALDSLMDIVRSLPSADKLSVQMEIKDVVPPFLHGDSGITTQVLLNLVSNSVKFTERGYVKILVNYDEANDHLIFEVSDSGCGISRVDQAKIFEPFERGRIGESGIEGTGLGLAIAKQLTESVGGRIQLSASGDTGSTFMVVFPMPAASATEARRTAEPPAKATQTSPLRVLVAEDVAANRMVIDAILRKQGHSVRLVTNGLEAIQAMKTGHFDAVLMDVQMPVMDGLQATQAIRKLPDPAGKTLVIGLTAFVEPEQHARMQMAGMDICLTKPLQTADLLTALARTYAPEIECIMDDSLHAMFLADVCTACSELASCLDDTPMSRRAVHKLHGLFAMFDKPLLAQLASDAERSGNRADAQRLLDAVDDLLNDPEVSAL